LTIERLGAKGDGIGHLASGEIAYVAFTLPGEDVRVRLGGRRGDGVEAELEAVLQASPDRAAPPCRHFGQCGGCALQHLDPLTYRTLKSGRISGALARQGITGYEIAELLVTPPATRRRVTFSAEAGKTTKTRSVVLGFNRRASHEIIDIGECVVATPAITALLQPLRTLLAAILAPGQAADIVVTDASSGLDVLISAAGSPDLAAREFLAEFATDTNLARLMWQSKSVIEPIAVRDTVFMRFGGRDVAIPPGAFLQATGFGEDAIVRSVLRGLPGEGRVADLFAGCGTLSFPIAEAGHAVLAVEGDEAALGALSRAARLAGGRIATERRDLERSPLEPSELKGFAAIVFDPPRAGAKAQARCLARSEVSRVIAVSCDPESFARDAAIMIEGGYRLTWVQPIDQFLWSSHVELVALFQRPWRSRCTDQTASVNNVTAPA
jgi:23S rRNA (uracil1939-C5)-methyltransferase